MGYQWNAIKSLLLLHFTLWVHVGHHSGGNLWSICEELGDIGWLIWTRPSEHDLIFLAVCVLACEWPSSYLLMFCDWRTLLANCDWIISYQWPPWHEVCTLYIHDVRDLFYFVSGADAVIYHKFWRLCVHLYKDSLFLQLCTHQRPGFAAQRAKRGQIQFCSPHKTSQTKSEISFAKAWKFVEIHGRAGSHFTLR